MRKTTAGLELEASFEISVNPKDTANWERGVWALQAVTLIVTGISSECLLNLIANTLGSVSVNIKLVRTSILYKPNAYFLDFLTTYYSQHVE